LEKIYKKSRKKKKKRVTTPTAPLSLSR